MRVLLGVMLLAGSGAGLAADLQLGLAAGSGQSVYRGESGKAFAMPLAIYEGEHFFVSGSSFGWKQPLNDWLSTGVLGEIEFNSFTPKDNDLAEMKQLDKRKAGLLLGGMLSASLGNRASASLSLLQDAGRRHRALIPTVQLDYHLTAPDARQHWSLTAAASQLPQEYMQYYYGVGIVESFRSGLPIYQAKAGSRYSLALNWRYGLSRDMALLARVSSEHLPVSLQWQAEQRSGSPMVKRSSTSAAMLGFSYRF